MLKYICKNKEGTNMINLKEEKTIVLTLGRFKKLKTVGDICEYINEKIGNENYRSVKIVGLYKAELSAKQKEMILAFNEKFKDNNIKFLLPGEKYEYYYNINIPLEDFKAE